MVSLTRCGFRDFIRFDRNSMGGGFLPSFVTLLDYAPLATASRFRG